MLPAWTVLPPNPVAGTTVSCGSPADRCWNRRGHTVRACCCPQEIRESCKKKRHRPAGGRRKLVFVCSEAVPRICGHPSFWQWLTIQGLGTLDPEPAAIGHRLSPVALQAAIPCRKSQCQATLRGTDFPAHAGAYKSFFRCIFFVAESDSHQETVHMLDNAEMTNEFSFHVCPVCRGAVLACFHQQMWW